MAKESENRIESRAVYTQAESLTRRPVAGNHHAEIPASAKLHKLQCNIHKQQWTLDGIEPSAENNRLPAHRIARSGAGRKRSKSTPLRISWILSPR